MLTGDVHFAQLYENKCPSLTGQNNLIEVCSSGLTHHMGDVYLTPQKDIKLFFPDFFKLSDPFVGLNYGIVEISFNPDSELLLEAKIKDIDGRI